MKKRTAIVISSLTMAIAGAASAAPVQANSLHLSKDMANVSVLDASTLTLAAKDGHVDVDTGDGHWHYDTDKSAAMAMTNFGNGSYSFDV